MATTCGGKEMFSNKIDREELKPGDHIYYRRIATALGATCTIAASDPPEDVRLSCQVPAEERLRHCIFKNNCEDLAKYCKSTGLQVTTNYGIARSGQLVDHELSRSLSFGLRHVLHQP